MSVDVGHAAADSAEVGGLPSRGQPNGWPGLARLRWLAAATALLMPVAGLPVLAERPAVAAPAAAPCVAEAASPARALAVAKHCARPVVVGSPRSEYAQVTAQPDGRLRFESAVVPQWTRRADGTWVDVDLDLARGPDGRVRPAASAAEVAFSGGGAAPLATLTREGKTLTVGWPATLPAPVLTGDTATYPEVLPGVDLAVQATRTGFTHVLVVKTATAAANPALRQVRFDLGGDARAVRLPDGSLRADVGTTAFATATPATMWNSAGQTTIAGRAGVASAPAERSSVDGPAATARTVRVQTGVDAAGDLLLTPDPAMLGGTAGDFPVYIDPAWSVKQNRWAYATNNGCSNSDVSVARVGLSPEGPCQGQLYRSFFQFPLTAMKGKHIESAYVQMKLDHSWSCDDSWAYMYHVPAIDHAMQATWSKMKLNAIMDGAPGHANEAGGCGVIQPDMTMNFESGVVTSKVQAVATAGGTAITVGFAARDSDGDGESTQGRWKKFFPNDAKLIVDYDSIPGKPNGLQVAGVACLPDGVLPIGTLAPKFSAVYPDADTTQSLTGTYEWIEVPAAGIGTVTDAYPTRLTRPPTASAPANGRATTAAVAVVTGKTYAYRVTAVDPAPYSRWSGWSPWCQFAADTTVPPVTVTLQGSPGGPGEPVTFRIESTATDATSFKYGWTGPTTAVTATGTPKSATVTLRPPKYGQNTLYVSAVDATRNEGYGSVEFVVDRPAPPIARWGLETYPGVTQGQALADQQGAVAGDTPLAPTNVSWAADARLLGGGSAAFNGTTSQAATAAPVLDTTNSFSVAAWVRPGVLPTSDMKVLTQDATDAARFEFGVRRQGTPYVPHWSFVMKDTSAQTSASRVAIAPTPITAAEAARWTHLAGVYDRTAGKLRLYVNGVRVAETDYVAAPWPTSGRFVVGRGFSAGVPSNWWTGNIADVQVFNRVLVDHDFTGQLATDEYSGGFDEPGILAPIEVGRWDMNAARPCYQVGIPSTCEAPDGATWGRRLSLTQGATVDAGYRDSGLMLDKRHFVEDTGDPYFGLSTLEYGWSQRNLAAEGSPPQWQDTPVLRTDDSFTVSVWVRPDQFEPRTFTAAGQRGTKESAFYLSLREYRLASGASEHRWRFTVGGADDDVTPVRVHAEGNRLLTEDDIGTWTHLVGVYDAQAAEIRLYVNGVLERSVPCAGVFRATGPLTVGAALFTGPGEQPRLVDYFQGGLDDLLVYQGALTDTAVSELHKSQALAELQS
ncbi:LamG domain-containing protein [Micromonospora ureilytica]|nr:LamG domain-containing protein [Micromonospora ureilytica]